VYLLAIAAAMAQANPTGFVWQSRNQTKADIAAEIDSLYKEMRDFLKRNVATLTKEVSVTAGLDAMLRAQNLDVNGAIPPQLRAYVCELNQLPEDCTDVAGRERIVLPDLLFDDAVNVVPYEKTSKKTLHEIVVKELEGCKELDERCRNFILFHNREDKRVLGDSYIGTIKLPVRVSRIELPLLRVTARRGPTATQVQDTGTLTRPAALDPVPVVAPSFNFLRRSLPMAPVRQQSNGTAGTPTTLEEMQANRTEVLRLIGHPLSQGKKIVPNHVVHVGVVDSWTDTEHCDLNPMLVRYSKPLPGSEDKYRWKPPAGTPPPPPKWQPPCGVPIPSALPVQDHGTHVLGLIASRSDSKIGSGVQPAPYVVSIEAVDQKANALTIRDRIDEYFSSPGRVFLDVVNFSLDYPVNVPPGSQEPVNDPLDKYFEDQPATLFVAAAGNETRLFTQTSACNVSPACLHKRPNVISVVAINRDANNPQLAKDPQTGALSNSGVVFSLSAPGENIASTASNNQIGILTGTSQATPLVTGAAALLVAKCNRMPSVVIKNRLIYTTDMVGNVDRFALGGRLNVGRALRYEKPEFSRSGEADPTIGWKLVVPAELEVQDVATGDVVKLPTERIKRVTKAADGDFWVFMHSRNACIPEFLLEGCPMERKKVRILTAQTLHFSRPNDQNKTFSTDQLLDYTAAIPPNFACLGSNP